MEFFKRTDNGGPRKDPARQRPAPRPAMTGAQALIALQANMEDPYADEE
jgi:hypothetical protein